MTGAQRTWRQRFSPRTIRSKAVVYLLLPISLLLILVSGMGFVIVRDALLKQWGQTAIATLQQTAHLVDMQLHGSKELLRLLQSNDYSPYYRQTFDLVVQRLLELDSVLEVRVDWPDAASMENGDDKPGMMMGPHHREMFHLDTFAASSPTFDQNAAGQVVTLASHFLDENNKSVGGVEVVFSFDVLVEQIQDAKWWQSNRAYLLNAQGDVLASASDTSDLEHQFPRRFFGGLGRLEARTWNAMTSQDSGTLLGEGVPPREVSGFYRLQEMEWTIVIISPGKLILRPLVQFRNLYLLCFSATIIVVMLLLIRVTGRVNDRISTLSRAADALAAGRFGSPLPETGQDEVTDLTRSFNRMSAQLKQRLSLKRAISIAREVQQNLLPEQVFQRDGVQIAGKSRYCDETGGDYYDLLTFRDDDNRVGVAIGDVVGHGIGAALLMTTVRALLRCRLAMGGRVADTMSDVNRLLCLDTAKSGSFITLFYLEVVPHRHTVRWVRAGHDPPLLYFPGRDTFEELRGEGIALGVDAGWRFNENSLELDGEQVIICLVTDGVCELTNEVGECFGKERLRQEIARHAALSPEEIVAALLSELDRFRGQSPQDDDVTLVVIKLGGETEGVEK